jgi:hypothetical protein
MSTTPAETPQQRADLIRTELQRVDGACAARTAEDCRLLGDMLPPSEGG